MLLGRNAMTNLDSVLKSRDILLNLQLFMVFFRQTSQRQSAESIFCKINVQCAIAQCAKKKKKSRDITLQTKVCMLKILVFPVVMYGCESWTIKKVEC